MTHHLTPEETIAAIERTLEPARAAHLDGCEPCRREVVDLGGVLTAVRAADEPAEPSPLFWDHMTARVRDAVHSGGSPARAAWGRFWQPLVGLAAAAAVLMWIAGRAPQAPAQPPATGSAVVADAGAAPPAEAPWDAVMELAAGLSLDEVHRAVPLRLDNAVLFDELSAEEQAALAELLDSELRGLE
jgi:hypothetical protein